MNYDIWFVYILECCDETLYCGITNNLEKRIKKHNDKKGAKYTVGRTPVKLVYQKMCKNKGEALKEEFSIKKLSRKDKIDLISSQNKL